ncbi:hypothetical protein [Oceaniglobus roseus]|nr:hypothetical protein [Kandeliimicrobium roseum]
MTLYEFAVPLVLFAVMSPLILWLRHEGHKLDQRIEAERKRRHHPAE